jgi:phosphoribosylformimino-5-aminoimidazole carboxamide ribotide isomerase
MEIIPAIDIKGGKCVRLFQGDFNRAVQFSDDPLDVALRWQSMGAHRLHIVDLDGAAAGRPINTDIIRQIAHVVIVPTELGGGIRDLDTMRELLQMGIERVILGTAAAEDPALVKQACQKFNDYVAVGIDAREGRIATHGWQNDTGWTTLAFAEQMVSLGVKRLIYTDIARDGTLTEPNFTAIAELIEAVRVPVIASGGVSSLLHLKMLQKLGAEGAIIGKALYTGDVSLKDALEAVS